jgi:hypothetical protein
MGAHSTFAMLTRDQNSSSVRTYILDRLSDGFLFDATVKTSAVAREKRYPARPDARGVCESGTAAQLVVRRNPRIAGARQLPLRQ